MYHRDTRKIDPTHNNRVEIGPTHLAFDEWLDLEKPDLQAMRKFRHERLVEHIVARDYAALLLTDPLNIRYATDSTNMQLWNAHNPFRAVLICADGYTVIWDYKNSAFLSEFNNLIDDRRSCLNMFYAEGGDKTSRNSEAFGLQIRDLINEHASENNRIAIDKITVKGLKAIESLGFEVMEGEELTEKARAIKGPDEIKAMRCAIRSCENSMKVMEDFARTSIPNGFISEDDVWAVLHAENIKRGGEWIETRLLTSGPRTNPWFQECGPRIIQNNEIIAFDTDLIGPYGMACDISRTWWIGDQAPRKDMIYSMKHAMDHIEHNISLLAPGKHIREVTNGTHVLDSKYQELKYGCMMHGVGLCDEWPDVAYPDTYEKDACDFVLQPGMVLCVEALVSEKDKDFSIKLEDQVLITETGYEKLSSYPYDGELNA